MFRFTIRELLILTVTAGLAVGWWLDHRANAAVAGDARKLAQIAAGDPEGTFSDAYRMHLQSKYGVRHPR